MTPELYNLKEGPVLNLLWFVVLSLLIMWVAYRSKNQLSGKSSAVCFFKQSEPILKLSKSSIAMVLILNVILFLTMSSQFDAVTNEPVLIFYSVICWIVFFGLIWSLADAVYFIFNQFKINLSTSLLEFNLVFKFFLGSRVLFLVVFLLGLMNVSLRISFTFISILAVFWAIYRILSNKTKLMEIKLPSLSNIKQWDKLAELIPTLFLMSLLFITWKYNTYMAMTSWDHFSQWLIIPHEMLYNDRVTGLYPITRAVSPGYPPQQVTEGSYILWLWGDVNFSDTVLNLYAPFMILLGALLTTGICRHLGLNIVGVLFTAILTILTISYSSSIYITSFYGDARLALGVLFIVSSLLFVSEEPSLKDTVFLAIIGATLFTVKPYAWPLAAIAGSVYFLFHFKWRWLLLFLTLLIIQFNLEALVFQSLVPESQIINLSSVTGRINESIKALLSLNFSNISTAYKMRDSNISHAILVGLCSVLCLIVAVITNQKPLKRLLIGICSAGLSYLFLTVMIAQLSPAYGNSIARYLSNTVMTMSLGVGASITAIYLRLKHYNAAYCIITTSVVFATITSLVYLTKAPPINQFKWYEARKDQLSRFPSIFPKLSTIAKDLQKIDSQNLQRVLIFPRKTRLEVYVFNYHLARTTKSVVSFPLGGSINDVANFLTERGTNILINSDIKWLYLTDTQEVSGQIITPGLYTRDEFIGSLEASLNNPITDN